MPELTNWKVSRMKLVELKRLAAQYDVQMPAGAKRPEYIAMILEKLSAGEMPAAVETIDSRPVGNKELFNELTADTGGPESTELQTKRGGFREGSGRKPGVTQEQSRIDNLPTSANRSVEYFIKWFFKVWANLADCKEIELDEDELTEFSVDTTQFLEYHNIKIPQGLAVDSKFVIGGFELIGGRFMINKAHKARMKAQAEKENTEQQVKNEG